MKIHGHNPRNGRPTPTYNSWRAMIERCNKPNTHGFRWYGERGITVCERWRDFATFLADMGDRPEGKTLDRIDVNGNYEPGNCRWITMSEQAKNRRPKTHCKNGHEFTPENIRTGSNGWRHCRLCYCLWYEARKREKSAA